MSQEPEIRSELKILVIGCSGTGKTSFVQRWITGEFIDSHRPTIVSEFFFKIHEYKGKFYKVQIWDIGGNDKSPSIAKLFSRDSHGCFVLSDATNPDSIEDTMKWKKVVSDESSFIDGDSLPFIFIQNKIDLIQEREKIKEIEENTKDICEKNDISKYFLVSVKENQNIEEALNYLLENIIERLEKYANETHELVFSEQQRRGTIKLVKNDANNNKVKRKNCC